MQCETHIYYIYIFAAQCVRVLWVVLSFGHDRDGDGADQVGNGRVALAALDCIQCAGKLLAGLRPQLVALRRRYYPRPRGKAVSATSRRPSGLQGRAHAPGRQARAPGRQTGRAWAPDAAGAARASETPLRGPAQPAHLQRSWPRQPCGGFPSPIWWLSEGSNTVSTRAGKQTARLLSSRLLSSVRSMRTYQARRSRSWLRRCGSALRCSTAPPRPYPTDDSVAGIAQHEASTHGLGGCFGNTSHPHVQNSIRAACA